MKIGKKSGPSVKEQNQDAWNRAFGLGSGFKKKVHTSEWHEHMATCRYLRNFYPEIRFYSTLDGFNLGEQRSLIKSLQWIEPGVPDLFIFGSPVLVLELKKVGARTTGSDHLVRQKGWLDYLASIGFKTSFAIGFEEAKKLIDKCYGKKK